MATTKDSVAMIPAAGYLIQESMPSAAVPTTFDLVACDDVRPSFEMPSMDHLDRVVVMIGAYFAAALRPYFVAKCANLTHFRDAIALGQTLRDSREPNLAVALDNSGKRFAGATENLDEIESNEHFSKSRVNKKIRIYLVMLIEVEGIAMDPSVNRHRCMPFDAAIGRNAINQDANFPISLGASIWLDGSGTKPATNIR